VSSTYYCSPGEFGILGFYEGYIAKPELPTNVYRVDGKSGKVSVVAGDIARPNGLAFSPDESKLYIVEGGTSPRSILAYDVGDSGTRITNKRKLIDAGPGTPDGFRCDVDGNLWCGWGMGQEGLDGVHVFNPDGKLIGRINLPERCANICFGGTYRNRLFMTASTSLYHLYVEYRLSCGHGLEAVGRDNLKTHVDLHWPRGACDRVR
jgi:gluconolactonase